MRQPARQSVVEHKTCCENCDIPYAVTYVIKENHLSKMLCQPRLVRRNASVVSKIADTNICVPSITDAIEKPALNTVNVVSTSAGNHLITLSVDTSKTTKE